ncbi:hypothetical protein [uncultured Sneathiella sp.]|uniref:hypothetical protein n=1 Tax=uncultured Sneathiella sp. TaxID=879315 RepID=UPI0030EF8B2E
MNDDATRPSGLTGFREKVFDFRHSVAEPWPYGLTMTAIVLFGLWHIATNVYLTEPGHWQNCIHFGGFAFLAAISSPLFKRHADRPWAIGIDILYGLLVAAAAMWIAYAEDA